MKVVLILSFLVPLCTSAIGQRATRTETVPGSIVVLSCDQCPVSIKLLPEISYPAYVGYGPHIYTGTNGVVIEIEKDGTVSDGKAISGHPYFRKMLEEYSTAAKFGEIEQKTKAVLQFRISAPQAISADSRDTTDLSSRSQIAEPMFTEELREACAAGSVTVDVAAKNGSVEIANPISGDPILFPYALSAAFRSKLPSDRSAGRLTIKFPHTDKCVFAGELNKKIVSMPRIPIHGHARVTADTLIAVRVVIDQAGHVIYTKTMNGHPLIRVSMEHAVRLAKFQPTMSNVSQGSVHFVGVVTFRITKDLNVSY